MEIPTTDQATDRPLWTVRILAAISVTLALTSLGVAMAWSRERHRAEDFRTVSDCYRRVAEEDRIPQASECEH